MIRAGQRVWIKPDWQDAGDDQFEWFAVDDESKGRMRIRPSRIGLAIPPTYVVKREWLDTHPPDAGLMFAAVEPQFELTEAALAYLAAENSGSGRGQ